MFLFCLVFAMSLSDSVYMCFVVTCWERDDLLALVCGVYCEFVTFPLVSWVRCGTFFFFFCGFPWVETSTAGRVYDLCVYYMTGAPEGSPKVVLCGFMEKPGIEPATPGLQGIALIHYTTGGSGVVLVCIDF